MLEDLKRKVFAGKTPEEAWELFRRAHFPKLDDDEAKDALLEWAEENKIEVTLFTRKVNAWDVLYVMFEFFLYVADYHVLLPLSIIFKLNERIDDSSSANLGSNLVSKKAREEGPELSH